jgi:hypothetical protein
MVDRMDSRRHWLVQPKRLGDKPRVIATLEAVEEWARLGYTVDGPFVPEARYAGAVKALEEIAALTLSEKPRAVGIARDALGMP